MENLIALFTDWTYQISGLLWKNPLTLLVLLGTGLYLTIRMRLIQIRGFRHAVHLVQGKYSSHMNLFMALPNLLGLILLSGLVKHLLDDYHARPQHRTR